MGNVGGKDIRNKMPKGPVLDLMLSEPRTDLTLGIDPSSINNIGQGDIASLFLNPLEPIPEIETMDILTWTAVKDKEIKDFDTNGQQINYEDEWQILSQEDDLINTRFLITNSIYGSFSRWHQVHTLTNKITRVILRIKRSIAKRLIETIYRAGYFKKEAPGAFVRNYISEEILADHVLLLGRNQDNYFSTWKEELPSNTLRIKLDDRRNYGSSLLIYEGTSCDVWELALIPMGIVSHNMRNLLYTKKSRRANTWSIEIRTITMGSLSVPIYNETTKPTSNRPLGVTYRKLRGIVGDF